MLKPSLSGGMPARRGARDVHPLSEIMGMNGEKEVVSLVRLQSFNGSFHTSETLSQILGQDALDEGRTRRLDMTAWATTVAVAYLKEHLTQRPDLLEVLVEKALECVMQAAEIEVEALVVIAGSLVP